jgi:acyl-coenzyme A synthetase/AMP-(fatty) acid ligase
VRELHAAWNALVGDATFFSAASHQHLYGLLFGVLWPLHAGRPFQRHHHLHPGELVPRMQEAGDCVLTSVPTHLKRLARHAHTASLRERCRVIFSSGGPLAAETASEVADVFGAPPIEVLGSTETGGIAWRSQHRDEEGSHWKPFAAVQVTCDRENDVLRVRSPFVSVDAGDDGFATGDRVTLRADGSFDLEGRLDHVVKVGEKRLDLTRMESEFRTHPSIDEVALTTIDREGERRVAATVVPSNEGWELIRHEGQREFVRALGVGLADSWDPVLHPRYWRVVSALPANAQGKITLDVLRELFRPPEVEGPQSDRPEVLGEFRGVDFLERSCRVPPQLRCFEGHFPGYPIVPGVLQLDWAMELASELLAIPLRVEEIESLKFPAPLGPGNSFQIGVRVIDDAVVEFRISGEDAEYARGRVRLDARTSTSP